MARTHPTTLPLIALPRGTVLLPGVVQRITVSSTRADIASLLAVVYTLAASKTPNGRIDSIPIACVPFSSPSGPDAQLLTKNGEPAKMAKADLFLWGVTAKISGVEGSGTGEFTLLVEGVSRLRVDKVFSDKAYLEARVVTFQDDCAILPRAPCSCLAC